MYFTTYCDYPRDKNTSKSVKNITCGEAIKVRHNVSKSRKTCETKVQNLHSGSSNHNP